MDRPAARTPRSRARAREAFPGGRANTEDGLTLDFPDWRFTLRPSNTEPVLRLTVEAYREGLAESRRDEIIALVTASSGGGAEPARD